MNARYYHTARTAHLERLSTYAPGIFFYSKTRADFDPALADRVGIIKKSAFGVVVDVLRRRINILEVPEPFAVKLWPQLLTIHVCTRIAKLLHLSNVSLRSYAIENFPIDVKVSDFFRLPLPLSRAMARLIGAFLVRTSDAVVFGTEEARDVYMNLLGRRAFRKTKQDLIWHIPTALSGVDLHSNRGQRLVFLGTFEERKGVLELLESWSTVRNALEGAHLTIMGKGLLQSQVESVAHLDPRVDLILDPSREEIFQRLGESKALALFSKPAPGWKEQVGLPIVEGLAAGCEIVTSDETGIRAWLREHGHHVVPVEASVETLAAAIIGALTAERGPEDVIADLPPVDGRKAADDVLFADYL